MDYAVFEQSRDLAWKVLLQQGVRSLPVDVLALCRDLRIQVREYREPRYDVGEGFSCMIGRVPYICLAPEVNRSRRRFTIAHELGHILLGHVGRFDLVNREPLPRDDPIEQAANGFAAKLLAPACVLWGCGVTSADEIAALCEISLTAARFREKRLHLLMERGRFCDHPLERRVYHQFLEFITAYRERGQ